MPDAIMPQRRSVEELWPAGLNEAVRASRERRCRAAWENFVKAYHRLQGAYGAEKAWALAGDFLKRSDVKPPKRRRGKGKANRERDARALAADDAAPHRTKKGAIAKAAQIKNYDDLRNTRRRVQRDKARPELAAQRRWNQLIANEPFIREMVRKQVKKQEARRTSKSNRSKCRPPFLGRSADRDHIEAVLFWETAVHAYYTSRRPSDRS